MLSNRLIKLGVVLVCYLLQFSCQDKSSEKVYDQTEQDSVPAIAMDTISNILVVDTLGGIINHCFLLEFIEGNNWSKKQFRRLMKFQSDNTCTYIAFEASVSMIPPIPDIEATCKWRIKNDTIIIEGNGFDHTRAYALGSDAKDSIRISLKGKYKIEYNNNEISLRCINESLSFNDPSDITNDYFSNSNQSETIYLFKNIICEGAEKKYLQRNFRAESNTNTISKSENNSQSEIIYEGDVYDDFNGISQHYILKIKSDFSAASIAGGAYSRLENQGNGVYVLLDGAIIGMSIQPGKTKCIIYGSDGNYFTTLYRR